MEEPNGETSLYEDDARRDAFLAAYDDAMEHLWPVPFEARAVPTRYGSTHVVVSGPADGVPVVLLPGGGACAAMWFTMVGDLAEAGYRTYALDRVGDVGRSTIIELPSDEQAVADWLLDALDQLGLECPPMIGLSYGGFVNINMARFHPDRIDSIIMLTPGGVFARLRRRWTARMVLSIMSGYEPLIRNAYSYISAGRKPDERMFALGRQAWATWKGPEVMPPVYSDEQLRAIEHPSLLLVGDKDVIYDPRKVVRRATDTMPNIEAELIPDGGHTLSTDEPEAVNSRIIQFLDGRRAHAGSSA